MDRTPKVRPPVGKLLSSTLLWCCLFFSFSQFVIFDLALSGVKRLIQATHASDGVHSWTNRSTSGWGVWWTVMVLPQTDTLHPDI